MTDGTTTCEEEEEEEDGDLPVRTEKRLVLTELNTGGNCIAFINAYQTRQKSQQMTFWNIFLVFLRK